jgi:CHASE3 domain sensor protein
MARADESPWHSLDKRMSIAETRLDHVDGELRKMNGSLTAISIKVDENTIANRNSAAAIVQAITDHEHREEEKAQQRYVEHRREARSAKRWTVSTLISIVATVGGWWLHSNGYL